MTQYLPPPLLRFFAPREPLDYKPPMDLKRNRQKRKRTVPTGMAEWVAQFEDPSTLDPNNFTYREKKAEKDERVRREKQAAHEERVKAAVLQWKPNDNANATKDAYKTVLVARLAYETTDAELRDIFSDYGPVVAAKIVRTPDGKSRGYGFVEYEEEGDMRRAFKEGDARKIHGRRVLVDVERGRTVSDWLPRRFGGGAGFTRKGKPSENQTWAGREPPRMMDRQPRYGGGGGGGRDRDRYGGRGGGYGRGPPARGYHDRDRPRGRDRRDDRRDDRYSSARRVDDRDRYRARSPPRRDDRPRERSPPRRRDRSPPRVAGASEQDDESRHRRRHRRRRDEREEGETSYEPEAKRAKIE